MRKRIKSKKIVMLKTKRRKIMSRPKVVKLADNGSRIWYTLLQEDNVKEEETLNRQIKFNCCKVEQASPEIDWKNTWR